MRPPAIERGKQRIRDDGGHHRPEQVDRPPSDAIRQRAEERNRRKFNRRSEEDSVEDELPVDVGALRRIGRDEDR